MISVAFYSHLKADSALMAVCRWLYPHVIPQGKEAPAMVYNLDSDDRQQILTGQGGYRLASFSVDCYATRSTDSHEMADAVESALIGYAGTLGTSSPSIGVDHVRLERRFDIFERETKYYRTSLQFTIGYEIG